MRATHRAAFSSRVPLELTNPGTRWRRPNTGRQALLTLAHLHNGQSHAQLAVGFGVGTTTVHRHVTETVGLLTALAPTFAEAVRAGSMKEYVI